MLKLVIEKELRDIISSAKFAVTFGVCSLLILLAFYVGTRNYQVDQASYEAAKAENLRQLEGVTDWISVRDHRVFLPPQPLAVLVSGISNDIGRTTSIQGRGEPSASDSRYGDDPVFAVFRFLDLEFLFGIVLSLFAIVFAYDAVNGEKERGTLRLTFANAIPRDTFILGKLIGSFLALAVPLLIPLLFGSALLPALGVSLSTGEWAQLGLIVAAGILYFSAFLAFAVFVSALTQRSSSSFLMLLVVWILAVLIVPRASVLLAGRAVDVPTVDEIGTKKSRLAHQLWTEDRTKMASFKPATKDMSLMVSEFNKFMSDIADERDRKMRELGDQLNEERVNAQRRQQKVAFGLARVSPAAAFSLAVTTLAGTSLDIQDRYHNATIAYQQIFGKFMFQKTGLKLGGRVMAFRTTEQNGEKPKPIDPQELPAFEYSAATLADVLPSASLDLGLLALFNLVFFAGAFVAFLRYDVR
jgi:ABC-type transport system involved in multi-copper enzyme maturation permease subunit